MKPHQNLPFEIGQLAESKTFENGFRGAWFRCKIKKMNKKKGLQHYLEFFDFPDEKAHWTKVFQKREAERDMHLMVRPSFPSIYRESQMQDTRATSDVIAIVDDVWKVGDLVDWWFDSCYWCGRITHLLGEDKVMIKLHDPPVGEGQCYEASCKDLRPSLDWSPECGWTLPISSGSEACVRLIQPTSQETGVEKNPPKEGSFDDCSATSVSSHGPPATSPSPETSTYPPMGTPKQLSDCGMNEETQRPCAVTSLDFNDFDMGKPSFSDSISSTHVERLPAETEKPKGTIYNYEGPSKRMRVSAKDFLNSSLSDTLESSILDLEELVNKVKWLKRVHHYGIRYANSRIPAWKFLEDHISFTH
ncbi:hypothetical protein AQUCO_03400419v1 [Aquilegia coerulea]|uniref:Agenet domain-containing protein n=1 Tax=Aquilegia coerulea TaxID=218851 RepID=A0A2G5CZ16_AQUCA|nr:hypothetical protein AQUCO_03400419v1 [Aquilegia coerulea]PIA36505.1 hypothetical protein AQUCO_03400419v1 [Aquilegia coerulea]